MTPSENWRAAWALDQLGSKLIEQPLRSAQFLGVGLGVVLPLALFCVRSSHSFTPHTYHRVQVGVLSGAMGIGATPIMISFLALKGEYAYHTCVGTALCAIVPCNLMGSVAHAQLGNVHWSRVPVLAAGAAVGGALGSAVSLGLPSVVLQQIFAGFCAVSGGSILHKSGLISSAARRLFAGVHKSP